MSVMYIRLSELQIKMLEPFSKARFTVEKFAEYHGISHAEAERLLKKLLSENKLNLTHDSSEHDFRIQQSFYSVPFGVKAQITQYTKSKEV